MDRIGKSWGVAANQMTVIVNDGDCQLGEADTIDDVSSIVIRKTVEAASRVFGRETYKRWMGALRETGRFSVKEWMSEHALSPTDAERADGCKVLAEHAAPSVKTRPGLQKQKSMMAERKDKAREGMKEDGVWVEPEDVKLIRQVLTWCKSQLPQEHVEASSHQDPQPMDSVEPPDGMVVLPQKHDDDDFFIAPTAKNKSHKRHKPKKAPGHTVTHDAHSLKLFASLDLEIPATPEDCQKVIEDLKVRLAERSQEDNREEAEYWRRRQEGPEQCVEGDYQSGFKLGTNVWSWGPTIGHGSRLGC
jgi:hypothetical protein